MFSSSWLEPLSQAFQQLKDNLTAILPNLLGALILLLFGLIVAFILRAWIRGFLKGLNHLVRRRARARGLTETGVSTHVIQIVSRIVFWLVLLFFLAVSLEHLGQPVISGWLKSIAKYMPNILAALLIIFLGLFTGNIIRAVVTRFTKSSEVAHGELIGQLGRLSIIITSVLIAIDQLGIDINLLIIIIAIIASAISGGIALAFALGAKTAVRDIIASHYVTKNYSLGQTVRVGEIQGRIIELTLTSVCVETNEGRMYIPAHRFSQEMTLILKEES